MSHNTKRTVQTGVLEFGGKCGSAAWTDGMLSTRLAILTIASGSGRDAGGQRQRSTGQCSCSGQRLGVGTQNAEKCAVNLSGKVK